MSSHRIQQVNELIRQELSKLFVKEISFPKDCLVTITKVDTSKDLGQTKVLVSIMPAGQQEKAVRLLNKQAGHLQFLLGKIIVIRQIPKLLFQLDHTQEKVARIDQLIDKIHEGG